MNQVAHEVALLYMEKKDKTASDPKTFYKEYKRAYDLIVDEIQGKDDPDTDEFLRTNGFSRGR